MYSPIGGQTPRLFLNINKAEISLLYASHFMFKCTGRKKFLEER
jgi:hypothetical protein